MTRRQGTMPSEYFDDLYASTPDPWGFASKAYEQDKYSATLNALSRPHYRSALEIGCSIGIFTDQLAPRCDALVAIDGSGIAIEAARRSCARRPNVTFMVGMAPEAFPAGAFDLIILSEVLYYLGASDLDRLASRCLEAAAPGGEVILCHWLGETDYPLTGRQAHDLFIPALRDRLAGHALLHDDIYLLDRLSLT